MGYGRLPPRRPHARAHLPSDGGRFSHRTPAASDAGAALGPPVASTRSPTPLLHHPAIAALEPTLAFIAATGALTAGAALLLFAPGPLPERAPVVLPPPLLLRSSCRQHPPLSASLSHQPFSPHQAPCLPTRDPHRLPSHHQAPPVPRPSPPLLPCRVSSAPTAPAMSRRQLPSYRTWASVSSTPTWAASSLQRPWASSPRPAQRSASHRPPLAPLLLH